jgi:small subunit ribosomal protein S25e
VHCRFQMKLITTSMLVERFKINGSLARKSISLLMSNGVIRLVLSEGNQRIYTRATNTGD